MNINEVALFLTASVVRNRSFLSEFTKPSFPFEVRSLFSKEKTALVVSNKDGGEKPFFDFISGLSDGATVTCANATSVEEMDPRLSGFMGSVNLALMIESGGTKRAFAITNQYSLSNAIHAKDLKTLIEAQDADLQPKMWAAAEFYLSSNLELNDQPRIPNGQIQSYVADAKNEAYIDSMMDPVMTEIQVESFLAKREFKMPTGLKSKVYKGEAELPPRIQFRFDQTLKGQDIVDLIEAQKDKAQIWNEFNQGLAFFAEEKGLSQPVEWPKVLKSLPDEEATNLFGFVIGIINGGFGGRKGYDVEIPQHLKAAMEPQPILFENPRDRARYEMGSGRYFSESNPESWQRLALQEVEFQASPLSLKEAKSNFAKAIKRGESLAEKINPAFAPLFKKSHEGLESTAAKVGLEEQGPVLVEIIETYEPNQEKRQALFAAALCGSLFGGMGSWNDIIPETKELEKEFQDVSRDILKARNDLLAAALTE